jgi:two-component system LytT family response regulator
VPEVPRSAVSDELRLVVKQDGGVTLLRLDEIDCFEADGNVVSVLTSSGETHQLREPLAKLLEQLASRGFIRIHRGAIVRSAAVVAVEKGRYRKAFVVLRGGAKLEIGRAEFQKLRALWQPGLLDLRELGAGLQLVAAAQ